MNEKIKKLAEQAGYFHKYQGNLVYAFEGFDLDLFAELLLSEYLKTVYNEVQILSTHKDARYVCDKIKHNFS